MQNCVRVRVHLLNEFDFVNFFSLANNHINDCGEEGIIDSIKALDDFDFDYNGVYKIDKIFSHKSHQLYFFKN